MKNQAFRENHGVLPLSVAFSKTAATDGNLQSTENNGLYGRCLVAAFFECQREELYRWQINACQERGGSFQRLKRLNTREPSFYGNSGNKATASNHAAYSVALVIREVATKATHIFIYLWSGVPVAISKKLGNAVAVKNTIKINSVAPVALLPPFFRSTEWNYMGEGILGFILNTLRSLNLPPSWQAFFALLPFSQPWGIGSTSSPCTPTAQWRA
ncbi:hypothetical protein [Vreelandella titanicae]|uniref:hypothetical protein n=1 Tax=Vreelandella titanicae TaxID=664683 RepID=UPI00114273B6|nr:hypothetical protein [Halomonas titanicae]